MRKRWQRFSTEELRQLWKMWKEGRTYDEIGQAFCVGHNSVYSIVSNMVDSCPGSDFDRRER